MSLESPANKQVDGHGSHQPEKGRSDASALIKRAEEALQDQAWREQHSQRRVHSKEQLAEAAKRLEEAILAVERNNTVETVETLERDLDAAARCRVEPSLVTRARQALVRYNTHERRVALARKDLERVLARIDGCRTDDDDHTSSRSTLKSKTDTDTLQLQRSHLQPLQAAISKAASVGLEESLLTKAMGVQEELEKRHLDAQSLAMKLQQLLKLNDPVELRERLQLLSKKNSTISSRECLRLLEKVKAKLMQLERSANQSAWLEAELSAAAEAQDSARLSQLLDQARALDLPAPPGMVSLRDKLEQELPRRAKNGSSHGLGPAALSEIKTSTVTSTTGSEQQEPNKSIAALHELLQRTEANPSLAGLDACSKALSDARRCRGESDLVRELDARFTGLEKRHRSRLQKEDRFMDLLRDIKPHIVEGLPVEDSMVQELRFAVQEAQKYELSKPLQDAASQLLQKCQASQAYDMHKQQAEEALRKALDSLVGREPDLLGLEQAISECQKCGIYTRHAEQALQRCLQLEDRCEDAEAEVEAAMMDSDGGSQSRERLERAMVQAKASGVSGSKLQIARQSMAQFARRDRHCHALAGHFRRILPELQQRPWLYLQAMDRVTKAVSQPWPAELARAVAAAESAVQQQSKRDASRTSLEKELEAMLSSLQQARESEQAVPISSIAALSELIARARSQTVHEPLLLKAHTQLDTFRKHTSRKVAAEHRLRNALISKDKDEISSSLKDLQSFTRTFSGETPRSPQVGGGGGSARVQPSDSAQLMRLMEAGEAALQHLQSLSTRRSEAMRRLQQQIEAQQGSSLDSDCWKKEMSSAVQEAKQSGSPPSLIHHAKGELQRHRRRKEEHESACESLRAALSKKETLNPTEVRERLRTLQRLQPLGASADPLFPVQSAR